MTPRRLRSRSCGGSRDPSFALCRRGRRNQHGGGRNVDSLGGTGDRVAAVLWLDGGDVEPRLLSALCGSPCRSTISTSAVGPSSFRRRHSSPSSRTHVCARPARRLPLASGPAVAAAHAPHHRGGSGGTRPSRTNRDRSAYPRTPCL